MFTSAHDPEIGLGNSITVSAATDGQHPGKPSCELALQLLILLAGRIGWAVPLLTDQNKLAALRHPPETA